MIRRDPRRPSLIPPREIVLRAAESPVASIILVAFNQVELTLQCVASVARLPDRTSFELIVMDDGSSDPRVALWGRVENLKVHRNPENLGFLHSRSRGARLATGECLVFLNNDMVVKPAWLDSLIEIFEQRPDAGLAGSKLVYPNGVLQEAGAIIWRDGSVAQCGSGSFSADPRHSYLREADYCSGASIMLRKELFLELGGFSPEFAPGYYEDVDLAFRVRESGRRVYYQPFSEGVHLETASNGIDETKGVERYQAINRSKFREKWRSVLEEPALDRGDESAAMDRSRSPRILVVDRVPSPDRDSGSLRMYRMLNLLERVGCKVTLFASGRRFHERYAVDLQKRGIECVYRVRSGLPWRFRLKRWIRQSIRFLTRKRRLPIEEFLAERGAEFDIVVLSRADNAHRFLPAVKRYAPTAKTVFDTVDLHFLRYERSFGISGNREDADRARSFRERELQCARETDATIVVSSYEKDVLLREAPEVDVHIISNIHELEEGRRGREGRTGLLFIGGFRHHPNVDAVLYFAKEILPLVHRDDPKLRFRIVGADPPPEIRSLASSTIDVLGFVPDAREIFGQVCTSVAPLRYGAGVKGKITQSFAHGVPVVTTSIGAEGVGIEHGENALVADSPEAFARAVLRLARDEALWEKLSAGGAELVRERYSDSVAQRNIESLLRSLERDPRDDASRLRAKNALKTLATPRG